MSADRGRKVASPPETLDIALSLARAGWPVFPVTIYQDDAGKRHKVPAVKWKEWATTDTKTIAKAWAGEHSGRWIGVYAGAAGIVVLDVDPGGDHSIADAGHEIPPTFNYPSHRKGGRHHVYAAPEGIELTIAKGLLDGVDVRSGAGLMVYYGPELEEAPKLAPAPEWILVAKGESQRSGSGADRAPSADEDAYRARLVDGKPGKKVRKALGRVKSHDMSHDDMLESVTALVTLGVRGHAGVGVALDRARETYSDGWPDAGRAWDNAVAGSVRRLGLPPVTFSLTKAERKAIAKRNAERYAVSGVTPLRPEPVSLAACHDAFRGWLGVDYDLGALDAVLAAAVIERMDGDPAWLLLISGSGNAKTETVQSLAGAGAHIVSAIASEGALLSATSKGERSANATGGLLHEIGTSGILVPKDVTSMLSMDRTARGQVFAALREVYDGHWIRNVGTDGGRSLEWKGRLVVIGAVTTAWDRAHADTISAFGDRFVVVRMDSTTGRVAAGRKAIGNTGSEQAMRAELAAAAAGVLEGADLTAGGPNDDEAARILAAADLVTLARTAVDVDYRGNVIDSHAPEMPTRFAKQLAQIFRGGVAIGLSRADALGLAIRVARDSMPPLRLEILEDVAANAWTPLREVVKRVDKPRSTVDRQLQALHLLGLLTVDEEIATVGMHMRETTTWRYTLAPGVDVSSIALTPSEQPHTTKKGKSS
ncbi:bifunctional DNA primase/polymerase [Microbacterium aerolatum]|uniref:bifunctional DNA primase/polymerase n=1 Tax=Microbacterium aerolatum TaxID=153731 RepID=UPI00384D90AB